VEGEIAKTLSERLKARRNSLDARVAKAASLTPKEGHFVWWCNLNDEAEALCKAIPGAVEIRGSDKEEEKERKLNAFSNGEIRVLVTKAKIAGFGMNWQHCNNTGFVGMNDSFEQCYQAIRRFWRFGQTKEVNVHYVVANTEAEVMENIRRKEAEAERMGASMVAKMSDISSAEIRSASNTKDVYNPTVPVKVPAWIKVGY
jgi:superfamily II DNA/RNA helicase